MLQLPEMPSDADLEIRTRRLKQIPLRRAHAEILFPILSNVGLYAFTGGSPPASVEALSETYAFLESRRSPDGEQLWFNWLIWETERGEGIGFTQATIHSTYAYVAWVVGARWQRLGYASEAAAALVRWLTALGLPEVRACVNPQHAASRRVAGHAGMSVTSDMIDGEEVWVFRSA